MALATSLSLLATGCSSGQVASNTGPTATVKAADIKIVLLHKLGTAQYMIDEGDGAQKAASELGVNVHVVDLAQDSSKAVSEVQSAIAQHVSGIIIVPPDPSVGPQVASLAAAAGIPLIAADDQVCTTGPDPTKCAAKDLLPRVGFDGTEMGNQVGAAAADLFPSDGSWTPANTVILKEWAQNTSVCTQRVEAATKTFTSKTGVTLPVIEVGTATTVPDSQSKTQAVLNGHRDVKHWVVFGCADEDVQGAVQGLQAGGYSAADILGVGLGAYLACKDWQGGQPTGMKAALFINGATVGATAVRLMVDHLTKGTALPAQTNAATVIVKAETWQSEGLVCH
jgi:L-arabinose transport system substrate-binding protein